MNEPIEVSNLPEYICQLGGLVNEGGELVLPTSLGNGYIKIIHPSPNIRLMLQQYELHHNLILKRTPNAELVDTVTFSFRNVLATQTTSLQKPMQRAGASVQISSSDVSLDIEVVAHVQTSNILLQVDRLYLQQLLQSDSHERIAALVTNQQQSYLYEKLVSPKIQEIAVELFGRHTRDSLPNFHFKIKSEELIYLLLSSLSERTTIPQYPLNQSDLEVIYRLREEIIRDLGHPPNLSHLSSKANMSVSKLNKLFRQIFGDSIYTYFQKVRMQQAAYWLSEEQQSVSEVGYRLGFTNLSHFTRLFRKHTGINPKQYSLL